MMTSYTVISKRSRRGRLKSETVPIGRQVEMGVEKGKPKIEGIPLSERSRHPSSEKEKRRKERERKRR